VAAPAGELEAEVSFREDPALPTKDSMVAQQAGISNQEQVVAEVAGGDPRGSREAREIRSKLAVMEVLARR
jgi:hypothetical protein